MKADKTNGREIKKEIKNYSKHIHIGVCSIIKAG